MKVGDRGGNTSREFLSNVSVRIIADTVGRLRALVYIPIIAKYLGAADFGIWAQVSAVSMLLVPIFTARLETAAVRYLAGENDRDKIGRMIGTMLAFQAIVVAIGLTLGLSLSRWLVRPIFGDGVSPIFVVLLIILVSVNSFSLLLLQVFRSFRKINLYSSIDITKFTVQMVVVTLAVLYFHLGVLAVVVLLVMVEIAVLVGIFLLLPSIAPVRLAWEWTELKRYLRYSVPLVPTTVASWISSVSDRSIIVWYLGLAAAGVYSTSYLVGSMISFLFQPITFVLFPTISRAWENKDEYTVRKYIRFSLFIYLFLSIPALILITITGPYIIRQLAGEDFVTDYLLLASITAGVGAVGVHQIIMYVIYLHERTLSLTFLFITIAAINFVGNILLVPVVGIIGASIMTFVAYLVQMAATIMLARHISKVNLIEWPPVWKFILAASPILGFLLFPPPSTLSAVLFIVSISLVTYLILLFALGALGRNEVALVLNSLPRRAGVRVRRALPEKNDGNL